MVMKSVIKMPRHLVRIPIWIRPVYVVAEHEIRGLSQTWYNPIGQNSHLGPQLCTYKKVQFSPISSAKYTRFSVI